MADVELPDSKEIMEKGESPFTRRVALLVAVYAVALAIASLGGNNAAKEAMMAQQEASNQWARYQAKAIREHAYMLERMRLDFDLVDRAATLSPQGKKKADELMAKLDSEVGRFVKDKEEIEKLARAQEESRDLNKKRDPYFDYAEALLQIAIVVASISMLSQSKRVFLVSLVMAIAGIILTVNGYFLLFHLPFLG